LIALTHIEASEWPRYSLNAGASLEERVGTFKVEVRIPDLKHELRVFTADIMTVLDERYNETQKMIHLTEWTLGTEEFDQVGWKACELMRRGYSELRSLEVAPAQVFRFDESIEARAFLLQVFLNQWSAKLFPLTAPFCISIDEEHLWFELENAETVDYVIGKLRRWNPRRATQEVQ
jgi:hypothetical protein